MRTAVLDACVLYPAPLRDLLMTLGTHCPVALRWTNLIHEEWIRSLLENRPDLTAAQLARTRSAMDQALPNALVTGFEALIVGIPVPDPNDRHVVAAAIHGRADTIVTWNVRDFPAKILHHYAIRRQTPDAFVMDLLSAHEDLSIAAIRTMRQRLRRPPTSAQELLRTFNSQGLHRVVAHLNQSAFIARL